MVLERELGGVLLTVLGLLVSPGLLGGSWVMICLLEVEASWDSCLPEVQRQWFVKSPGNWRTLQVGKVGHVDPLRIVEN